MTGGATGVINIGVDKATLLKFNGIRFVTLGWIDVYHINKLKQAGAELGQAQ